METFRSAVWALFFLSCFCVVVHGVRGALFDGEPAESGACS